LATLDFKPKERIFILGKTITSLSVEDIIKAIYEINLDDEEKEMSYNGYQRPSIHILLNTYGGSVYDGLALIGAIELSATPVCVTCLGSAMSMGLFILASGHMRRAHHLSTIMYHEIAMGVQDSLEGLKLSIEEGERLTKVCENILFSRTKLTKKDLEVYKRTKSDWYMDPVTAAEFNIIDEVIGAPLLSPENLKKAKKRKRKTIIPDENSKGDIDTKN